MTNGDKIRSMSDAELLEFIVNNDNCKYCAFGFADDDCRFLYCRDGILEWLKSECDER